MAQSSKVMGAWPLLYLGLSLESGLEKNMPSSPVVVTPPVTGWQRGPCIPRILHPPSLSLFAYTGACATLPKPSHGPTSPP